MQLEISSTVHQ